MSDRKYVVIDLSNTDKVLFSQVNQSSAQSVRRNLANTQCLLSYRVEPSLPIVGSVMTQTEALTMLSGSDWSEPLPEE
jgi:hypothetical protein